MGFKQGSDMARFMVQKERSRVRVEQRMTPWKTWRPLRRRLPCLRRNGGGLDWGSGTRHGEKGGFVQMTMRKSRSNQWNNSIHNSEHIELSPSAEQLTYNSFSSHNNPKEQVRRGYVVFKVICLESGGGGIQAQAAWLRSPRSQPHTLYCLLRAQRLLAD